MMKVMKGLAVFLSFYIVLLSGITCVDIVRHDVSQKIELSQDASTRHHDANQCSPFCTCTCCQANFFVSNTPSLFSREALLIIYHEAKPEFQSLNLFDFLIPPKA